jgi:2-dehydropantoate 2-reductase
VALAREVYAIAAAQWITPEPFDAWQSDAFGLTRRRIALAPRWPTSAAGCIWQELAVRHRPTEVPAQYHPVLRLGGRSWSAVSWNRVRARAHL